MSSYSCTAAPNATVEAVAIYSARAAMYAAESPATKLVALALVEYLDGPSNVAVSTIIGADTANPGVSTRRVFGGAGKLKVETTVGTRPNSPVVIDSQFPLQSTV